MARQKKQSTEAAVREIRRRTRRKFSPEEKIRIVLDGLRGGSFAGSRALPLRSFAAFLSPSKTLSSGARSP